MTIALIESYRVSLPKSFRKILWKEHIDGFHIGLDHIRKWNEGMKNGVADASGKIVGKISDSTRGIYLRHCRAIWNECLQRGYLTGIKYPLVRV